VYHFKNISYDETGDDISLVECWPSSEQRRDIIVDMDGSLTQSDGERYITSYTDILGAFVDGETV